MDNNETLTESIADFGQDIAKELAIGAAIVAVGWIGVLTALLAANKITAMKDARRVKKNAKKVAVA